MSFDFSNDMPEDVQNVIGSAVDICNDDFNYFNFTQAFSQPTHSTPKKVSYPPVQPLMSANYGDIFTNQNIRSCPSVRQPVFTFDEPAVMQKRYYEESEVSNVIAPVLKLQITGNPNYEINESDILDIVSSYGAIVNIELTGPRGALITFDDTVNATNAQKALNGQQVKHLSIKLYLSWSDSSKDVAFKPQSAAKRSNKVAQSLNEIPEDEFPPNLYTGPRSMSIFDSQNMFSYASNKLTCKYDIQIEGDQDFKIARKIIGPKGCNMKKILEICQQQCRRANIIFQADSLKLRLRGRGSGFKEGPEKKESDDVLHLCVSSKHMRVHEVACKLVEDLLSGLYKEYGVFCQKAGRPLQAPVQIKRVELSVGYSQNAIPSTKLRKNSIEFNFAASASNSLNVIQCSSLEFDNSDKAW